MLSTEDLGGGTADKSPLSYGVIIPTLNGGPLLSRVIDALLGQDPLPKEVILVDSNSGDDSLPVGRSDLVTVVPVTGPFNHGRARNQGASHCSADYLVFMTQDAVPLNDAMKELLAPLVDGRAVAAFARHTPRSDATPLEQFARAYRYPDQDRLISLDRGNAESGVLLSNTCSAFSRQVFEDIGRFPTHTIMNEDMIIASRILQAGHVIAYVPSAFVEHSHNYTIRQTFMRYFDIGVVLAQAGEELAGRDLRRQGFRYARELFATLWTNRQYAWLPSALLESAAKWVGLFLGKNYTRFPNSLIKRLSMHTAYWQQIS